MHNIFLHEKCGGNRLWSYLHIKMDSLQWVLYAFDMILSIWFFCIEHCRGFRMCGCRMLTLPLILRNDLLF